MKSAPPLIAVLVFSILGLIGGVGVLGVCGFLALLINPHGGLYGGTAAEVRTFGIAAIAGGVVAAASTVLGVWALRRLVQLGKAKSSPVKT